MVQLESQVREKLAIDPIHKVALAFDDDEGDSVLLISEEDMAHLKKVGERNSMNRVFVDVSIIPNKESAAGKPTAEPNADTTSQAPIDCDVTAENNIQEEQPAACDAADDTESQVVDAPIALPESVEPAKRSSRSRQQRMTAFWTIGCALVVVGVVIAKRMQKF